MKRLNDLASPGVMISQIWPHSREKHGETLRALEEVLERPFFAAIQTVEIPYADERKKIAAIISERKLPYTYCVSRVLNENKLNLSDLNESNRIKSVDTMIRCLDDAVEAGADTFCIVSGPRPQDRDARPLALERLTDSVARLCEEARKYPSLKIEIEPLDYDAHKKNTLGSTEEAIQLCEALKTRGLDLSLCLDTAHTYLNHEEPAESIALAKPYIREFHFCNCVIDEAHPVFGDHHIPFGEPGVLQQAGIAAIMRTSLHTGFLNEETKPVILCEVFNRHAEDPLSFLEHQQHLLLRSWEDACAIDE